MRPSAPRAQTYSTMRPASQVPRMMSAQRVGPFLKHRRSLKLHSKYISAELFGIFLILTFFCSHSDPGSPTSSCSGRSGTWSTTVQVCSRSPQPPAAPQRSATSLPAAGRNVFLCQNHWFPLWRIQLIILCAPLPQPAVHVQGQEPLTTSMLAAAPLQEQKQMLGRNYYVMRGGFDSTARMAAEGSVGVGDFLF